MKIVLMIAAGIAVGLTVVMAVLIQVLQQLAPLLVVLAAVVVVLRLTRRYSDSRRSTTPLGDYGLVCPPDSQAPLSLGGPPAHSEPLPYLRWGSVDHSFDAPSLPPRASTRAHRARAGARPPARSPRTWR